MTIFQNVPTVSTSDAWSASQHNTYIRDNFKAIMENAVAGGIPYWAVTTGFSSVNVGTVTGGILYGNGTIPAVLPFGTSQAGLLYGNGTIPAVLAKGSAHQSVKMNAGATAPVWGQPPFVTQSLYSEVGHTYNSTTVRDMPNSSGTITLLVPSTVVVWARVQSANQATNCWTRYKISIDGTEGNPAGFYYGDGISVDFPNYGRKTGVAAGARVIKLREFEGYGAGLTYTVVHLEWIAIAIPE